RDRVVAPVVGQAVLGDMTLGGSGVDRQQLDRGNPKLDEIVDDRGRGERGKGAALVRVHTRVPHRETAGVHLEEDRLLPRGPRVTVAVPGKRALDDPAFRHLTGAVAPVEGKVVARAAEAVGEQRVA